MGCTPRHLVWRGCRNTPGRGGQCQDVADLHRRRNMEGAHCWHWRLPDECFGDSAELPGFFLRRIANLLMRKFPLPPHARSATTCALPFAHKHARISSLVRRTGLSRIVASQPARPLPCRSAPPCPCIRKGRPGSWSSILSGWNASVANRASASKANNCKIMQSRMTSSATRR